MVDLADSKSAASSVPVRVRSRAPEEIRAEASLGYRELKDP